MLINLFVNNPSREYLQQQSVSKNQFPGMTESIDFVKNFYQQNAHLNISSRYQLQKIE